MYITTCWHSNLFQPIPNTPATRPTEWYRRSHLRPSLLFTKFCGDFLEDFSDVKAPKLLMCWVHPPPCRNICFFSPRFRICFFHVISQIQVVQAKLFWGVKVGHTWNVHPLSSRFWKTQVFWRVKNAWILGCFILPEVLRVSITSLDGRRDGS